MGVSDGPSHLVRPCGSSVPLPPAGVPARCSVSWPPWRRRGATTRRTTIRASANLRPCGWSSRRSGTSSGSSASPASPRATSARVVYPKMNAYILNWIVDIGDKVKKGDALANLFVPELVEDHRHEEGDGRARPRADRAGQGGRESGRGRRRGGPGAARGGPGGTRRLPGRGRALGLGDQAARQRAQEGRGQSSGCPPDHQSVEGVPRACETRRRRTS